MNAPSCDEMDEKRRRSEGRRCSLRCDPGTSAEPSLGDDIDWNNHASNHGLPTFPAEKHLPPQLHPAASRGLRCMSSCLSPNSNRSTIVPERSNSMVGLLSMLDDSTERKSSTMGSDLNLSFHSSASMEISINNTPPDHWNGPSSYLLYHDILMNVFTFLDTESLASFSETARRPNFECFYFLQLQLQRSLLGNGSPSPVTDSEDNSSAEDPLSAIAGVGSVTRLAALDYGLAEETVQEFLESNFTLRTMPLSHSLAYIRQLLRRSGLDERSMTSAALFVTAVGAASFVGTDAAITMGALPPSFGNELPNLIFSVGFVGSLMSAARAVSEVDPTLSLRERATATVRAVYRAAYGYDGKDDDDDASQVSVASELNSDHNAKDFFKSPQSPDPYEHFSSTEKSDKEEDDKKVPSGCVGAYRRAVSSARKQVLAVIKKRRRRGFLSLPEEDQRQLGIRFLDACRSDESLELVRELIEVRETIDVDRFYVDSDGFETCAVHTSAFHGSCKVLDYLCRGANEFDSSLDGGLCDINAREDVNGWTALHFAVAAYSVDTVRVLVKHGADTSIKAQNGDTPLEWATRLRNEEVVEELSAREREAEEKALSEKNAREQGEITNGETDDAPLFDCESLLCAHHESLRQVFRGRLHRLQFRIA